MDDFAGRLIGKRCGEAGPGLGPSVFRRLDPAGASDIGNAATQFRVRTNCVAPLFRGFFYKLQFTADLTQPFRDDAAGTMQAIDSSLVRDDFPSIKCASFA